MPIPPPPASLVVYLLTAFSVLVVVITRQLLGGQGRRVRPGHGVSRSVLNLHSYAGGIAAVAWVVFLAVPADGRTWHSLLGVFGLAAWWVTGWAGLFLLGRWLPSRGRHSDLDGGWIVGFLAAAAAYGGVAVASIAFTLAYVFGSI